MTNPWTKSSTGVYVAEDSDLAAAPKNAIRCPDCGRDWNCGWQFEGFDYDASGEDVAGRRYRCGGCGARFLRIND